MRSYLDYGIVNPRDEIKRTPWFRAAYSRHGAIPPRLIRVEQDNGIYWCYGFFDADSGRMDVYPESYDGLRTLGRHSIAIQHIKAKGGS